MGDDEFGRMLSNILKENNVNNSGMRFDQTARTALAFVTLRADGEREFLFFRNPSADMLLREAELDIALIKQVCAFFLLLTGKHQRKDGFAIILHLVDIMPAQLKFIAGKDLPLWFN